MADKIFVLDDGSPGSKLLQEEYKDQYDIKVIKVNKGSLVEQFTKVENKDRIKIFLPFDADDLVKDNELKRREIKEVESLGYRNLLVLPYEGASKFEIEFKAKKFKPNKSELDVASVDQNEQEVKPYRRTGLF